uniref:glycosyltransferase family 4 protein n=2 Tax=Halomonas sp. SH5A2 TaxID=2749040 RepID=UPI00237B7926|nr:glycosyltransferase family 4 protein [Halomonas sp. SH5A2]
MSGGTRSYEMARRMVAAGHEVHMVTSYREHAKYLGWFTTEEAGIQVHWYPVQYSNHMGFMQRIKAFLAFAYAARKKTVELNGDIIFATSTPLTIALPAVTASRKNKVPMVFEVRDLWPEMPVAVGALKNPILRLFAQKLEHWAYHNADAVVALSPGMKDGVVRTGYPEEKVAVIPNSSDNVEFIFDPVAASRFRAEREWLADHPLLVYTGTFGQVNGVSYLVEVAKELMSIRSNVKILLVGDGVEREKIVARAKELEVLEKNIFIEEKIAKCEMPALLSAATMASVLFVDLPEMRSNSANKFFDALASGTPVLLNYGGWMHDLVKSHGCGLTMWGCTAKEVAEELEEKMNDQQWIEKAGTKSRVLAEECFDRDLLANELLSILELSVKGSSEEVSKIAPGSYL